MCQLQNCQKRKKTGLSNTTTAVVCQCMQTKCILLSLPLILFFRYTVSCTPHMKTQVHFKLTADLIYLFVLGSGHGPINCWINTISLGTDYLAMFVDKNILIYMISFHSVTQYVLSSKQFYYPFYYLEWLHSLGTICYHT